MNKEIDDILSGKIQSFNKLDHKYYAAPNTWLLIANLLEKIQTYPSDRAINHYFRFIATFPNKDFVAAAGVDGYAIYRQLQQRGKVSFDICKLKGYGYFCKKYGDWILRTADISLQMKETYR